MKAFRFIVAHRDQEFGIHVSGQSDGDPLDMWVIEYDAKIKEVRVRKLTQMGNAPALSQTWCPHMSGKKCTIHKHDEYKVETRIPVAYDPTNVFKYREQISALMDAIVAARWPGLEITS